MPSSSSMEECQVVDGVTYRYLTGFGNELSSERIPGALPRQRNTPRKVPFNLYTEQLSGSAFTAPREHTKRTWLYRIQPSVAASSNSSTTSPLNTRLHLYLGGITEDPTKRECCEPVVDPLRWKPRMESAATTTNTTDFWEALQLHCHAGDPASRQGLAIYQYANSGPFSQPEQHYCNADGDFLIVPHQGTLQITTELGRLTVQPSEICVLPRGLVYSVASCKEAEGGAAAGYVLEIFSTVGFQLPELGPIGSNGLANPRDFLHPTAWCVSQRSAYDRKPHVIHTKQHSELFSRSIDHSPYNVVAWHGNYLPYKYDLKRFCAVNSVTYDHLDPSLYTVLTCPSATPGTALADFVIFPPRMLATDSNTLRPPWFHRNVMSEYMGLIYGQYDAKTEFRPGGASLHNGMTPHGPDATSYEKAVQDPCAQPVSFDGGLAFMFETYLSLKVAKQGLEDADWRDVEYAECWQALTAAHFEGWTLLEEQERQDRDGDAQE